MLPQGTKKEFNFSPSAVRLPAAAAAAEFINQYGVIGMFANKKEEEIRNRVGGGAIYGLNNAVSCGEG